MTVGLCRIRWCLVTLGFTAYFIVGDSLRGTTSGRTANREGSGTYRLLAAHDPPFAVRHLLFGKSRSGTEAGALYRSARTLYRTMQARPERYDRRHWERLAAQFRAVYYRHPTHAVADDAVYMEAEVYARLFQTGARDEDWRRAVDRYKFLITEYPHSPWGPKALLGVAALYRAQSLPEWASYVMECARLFSETRCQKVPDYKSLLAQARSARVDPPTRPESVRARGPSVLQGVRYWTSPQYTRIVLELSDAVSYRTGVLRDPDRLYIDLDQTVLSRQIRGQGWELPTHAHLRQVRVGQYLPDTARVVLDFDRIKQHRIFILESPYRIVVDIFQGLWESAGQAQSRAEVATRPTEAPALSTPTDRSEDAAGIREVPVPGANRSGTYSIARQLGMKVARIMLDPGHGGHDPGAIGVGGLREKDVTLAIARRLREVILQRWNVEVLMTRDDDRFVPLEERTAMANSQGVDLFISIHANASRNGRLHGVETYYLHWAQDPHAMEVAARENAVSTAKLHELRKFVHLILQSTKVEESRDLAAYLQQHLVRSVRRRYPIRDLGVKSAPFYVLMGAQMPAVLVETAFLTHDREGRLLADPAFQERVVQGLLEGLAAYLEAQGSLARLARPSDT
ncbi:MAG: N-acetylmuramoyl-L-alanine amidase [Acidobacteria bacterium]|nr:N-acetylmuramoyl-L-alanine amidase [Acidobacteriota bacterium]MDW7984125.1 N-acetylmuramoyl-L-alanine amidase [Acidobacteriota bacterium]